MKILMFFPNKLENLPPLLSSALSMSELGCEVKILVIDHDNSILGLIKKSKVTVHKVTKVSPHNVLAKIISRLKLVGEYVKQIKSFKPDVIWFHNSHYISYDAFLKRISGIKVVSHMHEIDAHAKLRWFFHKISCRKADVCILPERNRIWLMKLASKSSANFFYVPNRLHKSLMPEININGTNTTKDLFIKNGGSISCKRFFIYQGAFMQERCLDELIKGFILLKNDEIGLILLGGDVKSKYYDHLVKLSSKDKRIIILGYIQPPKHLLITSGCDFGVILYAPISFNNIYCAPNKIFEYAEYGLGQLLPEFPGISALNTEYSLGYTCNPLDPSSIKNALSNLLVNNKEYYKDKSKIFLTDFPDLIDCYKKVLNHLVL